MLGHFRVPPTWKSATRQVWKPGYAILRGFRILIFAKMGDNSMVLLTPGFSRVAKRRQWASRFNGLPAPDKPLKRFPLPFAAGTGLKPGVNVNASPIFAKFNRRIP